MAYGCKVEHIKLPIDCVDTHRPKPKVTFYLAIYFIVYNLYFENLSWLNEQYWDFKFSNFIVNPKYFSIYELNEHVTC